MMSVQFDCDDMQCFASEYVDVYEKDLAAGASLSGYIPDGWRIIASDHDGIAISLCPKHAGSEASGE